VRSEAVVPERGKTAEPESERCARCGRELCRGEVTYSITVEIRADWKERIPDTGEESLASYVARIAPRIQALPPDLLEQEIHREIQGKLCMWCKERFAANPFGRVPDPRPGSARADTS
jgi:hypothetical protein